MSEEPSLGIPEEEYAFQDLEGMNPYHFSKLPRKVEFQLLLLFAASLILRLYLASSKQVDYDESIFYAPTAQYYTTGDWFHNIEHPMLVKLIFGGSILLFGSSGKIVTIFPWLPESIGALRLVSAVMGAATCLVVYYLVKEVTGSHTTAFLPSVLLAFDPISIGESSYGLLDPSLTLFYLTSIFYFYRYVKREHRVDLYISAVMFGFAVASKYYAFIAIFVFLGFLLWKKKVHANLKPGIIFLLLATMVFFAVQPILWSNPIGNLRLSLSYNLDHLINGHIVKPPGNPFLIPQVSFFGQSWPYVGSSPVASKPDFVAVISQGINPPWWYNFYIQTMYSTPFELILYPFALYRIVSALWRRQYNDVVVAGLLLPLVPSAYLALQTVRLPQYTILLSTSATIMTSTAYLSFKPRRKKYFLYSLVVFHVAWTITILLASTGPFTGWGYYNTPLTPLLGNLFQLL